MKNKTKDNKEPETIIFNVKRLSSHPISIITTIILFIALIGITSSNLIFLNTIRGSLTLQQATTSTYYYEFIDIYPTLILNIACISAILSNLSKRLRTISKTGYLINIIISILLFFNLYSNNLRVGISYYLIIAINTILLLLPIKYHIVEEEIEISKEKESIYQNKNNKVEELNNKPTITKLKTIITISILIIELISIIIILTKNNNDIYKETIIQANSDFQIEVINDYINIRSSSNIEGEVLGTVNKGDIYNVLDISNTENHIWYKINYKGKKGYIASPKQEPYIKELFSNKLVVNVFCTKDNQDCGYLMEFLIKYQRSTAKAFLIKYQDLEDEYTKEIYNQVLKHFDIEESIPLLIIGDNKIVNYTKKSETTIIEVIQEQMENDTNIVTEIKKGNTQTKKDS
ncbi:MAG: SH3 domain-containing protein [Firmicutes bacterium]|nr:SH3 domain-containing protein [Bacillota bacterium]